MAFRKEWVMVVGGGVLQIPAVREVQSRGLKALVTDGNPDCPCATIADEFHQLSTYDFAAHGELARANTYRLCAVFTVAADVEHTVAYAAECAKLPRLPTAAAFTVHNKGLARKRMAGDPGLKQPLYALVSGDVDPMIVLDNLAAWGYKTQYGMVVKPVDNCGSRGLTMIAPIPTPGIVANAIMKARDSAHGGSVIIEERLNGPEQSVEIVFDEYGRAYPLNIVDRVFSAPGIELGHVSPSALSPIGQNLLFAVTMRAASALGVAYGVFKADTIWSHDLGPTILETTARLSGGCDSTHTTPVSTGRNTVGIALDLALGLPLKLDKLQFKHLRSAAAYGLHPGKQGELLAIDRATICAAKRMPGVTDIVLRVRPGDTIDWMRVGFVIAYGKTREEALERAKDAAAVIEFIVSEA